MRSFLGAGVLALGIGLGASAGEPQAGESHPAGSDAELAQKLANPVAALISVPLQFNYDCCFGPNDGDRYLLNIQPVVPVTLSEDWNLIVRTILPVIHQEGVFDDQTGLGDTVQSFFLSPPAVDGLTWAVGPVFSYPTGTDGLSSGAWGAGPTGLLLKQQGHMTYGVLANHVWSVSDTNSGQDIATTLLQPFFNYTWPDTTGLTLNTESTYDWENDQWTVPVNLTVSRIYTWGGHRVQLAAGGRVYLDAPDEDLTWGLRFVTTFLFPT